MYMYQGNMYLVQEHVELLRSETEPVKRRYFAVVMTLIPEPLRKTRKQAADLLGICKRQIQRLVKRFLEEGLQGLRCRSRRPKTSPRRIASEHEDLIVEVRRKSGFGPKDISVLINESLKRKNDQFHLHSSTTYNVLVRTGEIERERRIAKEIKSFEWHHPNRLIQADLTLFNGVPILTMEDDYSRKAWATTLRNQKDKTVVRGMKRLIKIRYDNLLTDNGGQFSRRNAEMRKYCEEFLNEKHIWTSVHHPETMGKLSAFQKALKRFLRFHIPMSTDLKEINSYVEIFVKWYNNGKYHSAIKTFPEVRYSGNQASDWYESIIKDLKLEEILEA